MGRNASALTAKQVAVLEWIKDGCPGDDIEGGFGRRITARALHRRGLVSIKGRGAAWMATITKAGRTKLDAEPSAVLPDAMQVDTLIQRVLAADGVLDIGGSEDGKLAHEQLVRMSDHSPDRPRGWRLKVHNAGSYVSPRYEVVLVRRFEDLVDPMPVPVPGRVAQHHPAVKAYLADPDWHLVSKPCLGRASRILQAIADEAPRRGLSVLTAEQAAIGVDEYISRKAGRSHLVLRSPVGDFSVRVREMSAQSDKRVQPRPWNQRRTRARWLDARDWEFVGTGSIELVVEGPGMPYNGSRHGDTKTITLEEKLPRVFRAIEIHRLEVEWREQEREREVADRRIRWEVAIAEARAQYAEEARWEAFVQGSTDWHAAVAYREFLGAARKAASRCQGPLRDDLVAQLDFVECRIDELDPIGHPERLLPVVPDPKPDDLKPYLHGWSLNSPDEALR